jgi:hypothetical protein
MMEAVSTSKTSVNFYEIAWRYILEGCDLQHEENHGLETGRRNIAKLV